MPESLWRSRSLCGLVSLMALLFFLLCVSVWNKPRFTVFCWMHSSAAAPLYCMLVLHTFWKLSMSIVTSSAAFICMWEFASAGIHRFKTYLLLGSLCEKNQGSTVLNTWHSTGLWVIFACTVVNSFHNASLQKLMFGTTIQMKLLYFFQLGLNWIMKFKIKWL